MQYNERITSHKVKIVVMKHHVNAYVGRKDNRKGLKSFLTTETIYDTSRGSMLDYCYYYYYYYYYLLLVLYLMLTFPKFTS